MARLFTAASNEIAANTTAAPLTAVPITMAGWARLAAVGSATRILCEIRDKDNATSQRAGWRVEMNASEQIVARASTLGASSASTYTATALSANTWTHVGGVFSANDNRIAYFNGVAATPETTSRIPTTVDCVLIGAGLLGTSTVSNPWDGDLAEWAVWDAALTDADMASLAAGASPLRVRPENLVCYFPLTGNASPEADLVGRYELTLTGSAKSDHPRIFLPSAQILQFPSAAGGGGGGFQAAWARGANSVIGAGRAA